MNKVSSNIEQHRVCTRQDKELEGQAGEKAGAS